MRSVQRAVVSGSACRDPRYDRNQVPPVWHRQFPEAHRAHLRAPRASFRRSTLWLYIPRISLVKAGSSAGSHCVQELEAWSLASRSQNPDTGLFVTSSGTTMLRPFSWRGWKTRSYVTRLFGTTLAPSMAALGVVHWISSLRAIPASLFLRRVESSESKIPVTCGPMSQGLLANVRLPPSFSKTWQATSIEDFSRSPASYKDWATRSKRACSLRLKSALHIGESAFSCWPTPTASMMGNRAELRVNASGMLWIPAADQVGGQVSIAETAKNWSVMRRLMTALGWRPGPMPGFPYSHRVLATIRPGSGCLPGEWILNPAFTEWMMGWPIGWTDPERSVTGFAPWLRRSRGALSEIALIDV